MVQKSKGAIPMFRRYRPLTLPQTRPTPAPAPRPLLVSRYTHTNPLFRLFWLQALAAPLPEALRPILIWTWMQPGHYNGTQAIPSRERQRLPEDDLLYLPAWRLDSMASIELELGRRMIELPRAALTREERNHLLREQGAYLAHIYAALVAQVGEATAQTVFTQRVRAV
jgi:hypothetical protein